MIGRLWCEKCGLMSLFGVLVGGSVEIGMFHNVVDIVALARPRI